MSYQLYHELVKQEWAEDAALGFPILEMSVGLVALKLCCAVEGSPVTKQTVSLGYPSSLGLEG